VTPPPVRVATPPPVLANPELRERLREWRRATAKQKSVPAYVVMHDTTLDELCLKQPHNLAQLLQITGIGAKKAELYGAEILALIRFQA
jgi:ATP-dependent DNA helicase RecQ